MALAALQPLHATRTQAGPLGQRFLGQTGVEAVPAEQRPERRGAGPGLAFPALDFGRPHWSVPHTGLLPLRG